MDIKMEEEEEPEVVEIPREEEETQKEPENVIYMKRLMEGIINTKSLQHLKKAIEFINKEMIKEWLLEIKEIYHYFCIISETVIDEQNLNSLVLPLNTFYKKIIEFCYEWKCLSPHFEGNYRLFNSIQIIIKRLNDRNDSFDSNVFSQCIPLMFSSMIIIVSTIYGLKEVAVISKPITDFIIKRKSEISGKTEEWKQLILWVTVVANICKHINSIDRSDDQNLIKFTLKYLDLFLGSDLFYSHISDKAIKYLSSQKSIDLNELFISYQFEISGHVLRLLDLNSNFNNLGNLLIKSMSFFGINTLPMEFIKHILPHFVVSCDQKTELFIEELSKIDGKKSEVIKTYLPDIIRHMFYSKSFNKSSKNIENVITFLSAKTNFDIKYRIKIISYDLINSYLMLLSEDYDSTLEVISYVLHFRENDPKYHLKYFFNNESEFKSTLNLFFLSFVHKFDGLMQDNSICLKEKMVAINSFVFLIGFLDKHCINTFRVKLFSTLKLIISDKYYSYKELIKSSVEAMTVFIRKVEDSYLCSQLLTICALMLPLMHFWPKETSNIFKDLIVKQKFNPSFQSVFKHLYFIPEMNELIEVTEVLKPYITCGTTEDQICANITLVVNNINHENSRVQMFSLKELSKLFKTHQKLIYKKCNNIKECDYFVNHIISQLMLCLKSNNEEVLYFAAECLGILGAIDPLKVDLEKPVISKEEKSEKYLNFNDKEFKVILITRLYRAITTSTKTEDQYCASYALQEVIKIFTADNSGVIDFRIEDLSQEMRDYCRILTKTKYVMKKEKNSQQLNCKTVFGSLPNMSYQEWLSEWLKTLFELFIFKHNEDSEGAEYSMIASFVSQTQQSSSGSVSESFDLELAKALTNYSIKSKILMVCYQLMLRRQKVGQLLLPYVVITALKNAAPGQKHLIVNEIQFIIKTLTDKDITFNNEIGHLTAQTVFHLYDYLKIWYKKRIILHKTHCSTPRHLRTARLRDREFKGVQFFLDTISSKDLAKLGFKCSAFSRSLRYIEEYIKVNENKFQEEIPFFQNIFIRLEEPDCVEGCNSKRTPNNPTLREMILTHEALGQIQEAFICSEKAIALHPNDFECQKKYLQISMDSFDQSAMVKTYGTGLVMSRPDWCRHLAPYIIEAVWRLGDWDQLEQLLPQYDTDSLGDFRAGIGELFCSIIKKRDLHEFDEKVMNLRSHLVRPLSAAAMEISGYVRGHKYIVDLHILQDINHINNHLITELNEEVSYLEILKNKFSEIIDIWDQRIDLVKNTINCQEPILTTQRALFGILLNRCSELLPLIRKQMFKSWLKSTKTARKSGNIQRSYNCLLEMNKIRELLLSNDGNGCPLTDIENCEAILETAKIQWNKNQNIAAIHYLKNEIERNYSSQLEISYREAVHNLNESFSVQELNEIRNSLSFGSTSTSRSQTWNLIDLSESDCSQSNSIKDNYKSNEGFAKLQLLYAKYCDRSGVLNQNSLAVLYRSVKVAAPDWEESHYNLAMYCHKILTNYEDSKKNNKSFSLGKPEEILEMKGRVVKSLVDSLKQDSLKHAHHSLPLLFNIWFDLGTDYINSRAKGVVTSQMTEEIRRTVEKMNNEIRNLLANAPLFIFFISFAQLTARVLHPNNQITMILKEILIKLICRFPHQSIWLLLRSYNSLNLNRKNLFKDVLQKASIEDQSLKKFNSDIMKFAKLMTDMCQKNPDSRVRPQKVRQLSLRKDFPELAKLFATNSNFSQILLPFQLLVNVTLPKSSFNKDYNPFPSKNIFIRSIDDCIDLLHSLQKPKKININGTDGKSYTILCKPNDDLRKDYCLIEFCNLLNHCFKRDSNSRRRHLKVKTYLVISLADTCGLIEWIPGLTPFRTLVEEQYRMAGDYDNNRDNVIKIYPPQNIKVSERIRRFKEEVLPKFKPVFGNWFASTYTDPLSWFSARQAYIRSSAVFSIVGYLLGLGDRHGENILIEELTGETVHVDLNCMFNKGEEFGVPEKVPFRMTQNMVHAMGVTEYEGTFRKACEHTLRVARDNKEALLNFVSPFRYDHLIEWYKNSSQFMKNSNESTIDTAERIVFNIEARLNGIPSRNDRNLPKGISLSVEGQESTDINNLGVMYIGWTPYI